jgi:uncharacterized protein (DUF427 family)
MQVFTNRIKPKPGQESVWDYPRPPRLEETDARIQIFFNNEIVADSQRAKRILETSHPPVYYIPPEDIVMKYLRKAPGNSYCEWKGIASYYTLKVGNKKADKVAWYYPDPVADYAILKDHVAFYAGPMDQCLVNGEIVQPQPGGFYGGWITKNIVGPFKGNPGSMFW